MFLPLLIVFLITFYLYRFYFVQRRKYPPGPLPLPILGNTLSMDQSNPGYSINRMANKYGGLATVWLGPEPNIVITDAELFKEAFVKHGEALSYRPRMPIMDMFFGGKYGIVLSDGPFWKEQRRFSLHVLRDFGFGRNMMEEKIHLEIDRLLDHLSTMSKSGAIKAEPSEFLDICIGSIIANIAMGVQYNYIRDQEFQYLRKINRELLEQFGTTRMWLLNSLPVLQYIPLFGHFGKDMMLRIEKEFRGYLMPIIEKGEKQVIANPTAEPENYVQAYWQEMKKREITGDMGHFSKWQLYVALGDLWGAGFETTATTLEWGILHMAANEEVQNKCHEEIDRVLGTTTRATMAHKQELPYVSAAITELQRIADILPMNIFHMAKEDVHLSNKQTIPAGTTVIGQMSGVHENGAHFKDPTKYNPQRFIDNPKLAELVTPFSLGKRQCLGESLARMELFLVFTTLLQKFHITLAKPVDVTIKCIGFTVHPQKYEAIFTPRK